MKNKPFVSVVVPFHNAERTIMRCIESLIKLKYPNYELIFIDNNSSDKSAEIVKQYSQIILLEEHQQSAYAARNIGIKIAKGDFIAFTDSDCVVKPYWLEDLILDFKKGIGCVAGGIQAFEVKNLVQERLKDSLDQERQFSRYKLPSVVTANAVFRKEVFDKIGGFDSSFFSGGDTDFCWRMQLNTDYKIKLNKNITVFHNFADTYKDYSRIMSKYYGAKYALKKKYDFVDYVPKFKVMRLFTNAAKFVVYSFFNKRKAEESLLNWLSEYTEIKALWGKK